jgi:hypothetical protein
LRDVAPNPLAKKGGGLAMPPAPTPPLAVASLPAGATDAVEEALQTDFPSAPKKLSKKGMSQMYHGGAPLSHREEAAIARDRPSQRAGNVRSASP